MHAPLELLAGVVAAAADQGPPYPNQTPSVTTTTTTLLTSSLPPLSSPTSLPPLPAPLTLPLSSAPHPPSPMFSAPIPHLPPPHSPPSDVTTSTATARARARTSPPPPSQKRAKSSPDSSSSPTRSTKRPFEAISDGHPLPSLEHPAKPDDDSQDDKKAMRAERNRQSAAASRERKKRHVKSLEDRVSLLTEYNTSLQYQLEMQKKSSDENEIRLQQEIASLRHQLSRDSVFHPPPPQNHPMTLHHLTHRGPVTY